MNILGIFYDGADPSASILVDGEIIAFAEEERFIRIKHATDYFPNKAIQYCLEEAKISIKEIDYITYGWDCPKYSNGFMEKFYTDLKSQFNVDEKTTVWQKRLLFFFNEESQRQNIYYNLRKVFGDVQFPEIKFIPHHYTHAFSAYFYSKFQEAVILTIDGSGDENCTVVWKAVGSKITPLQKINIPHSLGWYYAAFTEYLGFKAYNGEYKVMGLAAYGKKDEQLLDKVRNVLKIEKNSLYRINPEYIFYGSHRYSERFTDKLLELFGKMPRLPDEEITSWHENIAWAVQYCLEETVLKLVEKFVKETGIRNVCISGGVGLNIKMNEKIFESGLVDDIFVQPICSDTGTSFASAACLYFQLTGKRPKPMNNVYLGPSFSSGEIEQYLNLCKLEYRTSDDIAKETAKLLAQHKIVGWFQGRMEGGPRALGSRSILANPTVSSAKDRVNEVIKFREYWRPFCPSMLEEGASKYLRKYTDAPFMILGFQVNPETAGEIPAVVHVDNTVRVQLVSSNVNPLYHRLISEFEKETGVNVILNTSFNIKGEPIVCTPQDAIRTFFATGIDALAIGDCLIQKKQNCH